MGNIEAIQRTLLWLSGGANRARARGSRVQVICLVLADQPEPSILLVRSRYGAWMPPQEGVRTDETFETAFWRCLDEELAVVIDPQDRRRHLSLRGPRKLGALALPPERHGERPVADDVYDGPLSNIRLRRKVYWTLSGLVFEQARIAPRPRGTEVLEAEWFVIPDAQRCIRRTNDVAKTCLLLKALTHAERDLHGYQP